MGDHKDDKAGKAAEQVLKGAAPKAAEGKAADKSPEPKAADKGPDDLTAAKAPAKQPDKAAPTAPKVPRGSVRLLAPEGCTSISVGEIDADGFVVVKSNDAEELIRHHGFTAV